MVHLLHAQDYAFSTMRENVVNQPSPYSRSMMPVIGGAMLLAISGCGGHHGRPGSGPSGSPTPSHGKSPALLVPKRINTGSTTRLRQTITASLTGSGRLDRLVVTHDMHGVGSLNIVNSHGRLILALPHVARISVLDYGRRAHLPVVVTQSHTSCQTSHCVFKTYTYLPNTKTMSEIPVYEHTRYTKTIYRYSRKTHQGQVSLVLSSPSPATLSGWGQPDRTGLGFKEPINTVGSFYAIHAYQYFAAPGHRGQWVSGPIRFGPDHAVTLPEPLHVMAEQLIIATTLGLTRTADSLTTSPATTQSVANALSTFRHRALMLAAPHWNHRLAINQGTSIQISTLVKGQGLVSDSATVRFQRIGTSWRISRIQVTPTTLKVTTASSAFERLIGFPEFQHMMVQNPTYRVLRLEPRPNLTWLATIGNLHATHQFVIGARTGQISVLP